MKKKNLIFQRMLGISKEEWLLGSLCASKLTFAALNQGMLSVLSLHVESDHRTGTVLPVLRHDTFYPPWGNISGVWMEELINCQNLEFGRAVWRLTSPWNSGPDLYH